MEKVKRLCIQRAPEGIQSAKNNRIKKNKYKDQIWGKEYNTFPSSLHTVLITIEDLFIPMHRKLGSFSRQKGWICTLFKYLEIRRLHNGIRQTIPHPSCRWYEAPGKLNSIKSDAWKCYTICSNCLSSVTRKYCTTR